MTKRASIGAVLAAGQRAYDERNYTTALKEWRPLADQGDAGAQYMLGQMYDEGRGVPQDHAEAAKWYQKAANQGKVAAQFHLGVMCDEGRGVAQDYAEAARWYRKAADQGYVHAQYNLGFMYDEGKGVPQDYAEAYMWLNLAASRPSDDAQKASADGRDWVAKKMTAEQIAEAQRRAREWKSKSGENKGGRPMK